MNPFDSVDNKIEHVQIIDKPDKIERVIKTIRLKKGHTMFEYNFKKAELSEAKVERIDVKMDELDIDVRAKLKNSLHKKILYNPDCFYFPALNKTNAFKKLKKLADAKRRQSESHAKE